MSKFEFGSLVELYDETEEEWLICRYKGRNASGQYVLRHKTGPAGKGEIVFIVNPQKYRVRKHISIKDKDNPNVAFIHRGE